MPMPVTSESNNLPNDIQRLLGGCVTVTRLPVQWGDQDAFGHVNNVVYLRWFESARIDLLNACASSVTMTGRGLGPILASISCNYRRQLHFPDEVLVGSKVARIGGSSADIGHVVVSRRQQQIVADGISVIVIFDYAAGRPVRIPADLRGQLSRHLTHSDSATEASASDG